MELKYIILKNSEKAKLNIFYFRRKCYIRYKINK